MEKTLTSLHCQQTWEKEGTSIKIPAHKQGGTLHFLKKKDNNEIHKTKYKCNLITRVAQIQHFSTNTDNVS